MSKNPRRILWILGGVVCLGFAGYRWFVWFMDRPYQEELVLARKAGLPTSVAEFEATLPLLGKAENAAPYYESLVGKPLHLPQELGSPSFAQGLAFSATPDQLDLVRSSLTEHREQIRLVGLATQKPHCRFDRDWSRGPALLLPEYAQMKAVGKLVLARGTLAAKRNPQAAIADADICLKMAEHVREEPLVIAQLVAVALERMTLRQVACWSLANPERPELRRKLAAMTEQLRPLDLRKMYRYVLVEKLVLIELSETAKGRKDLGLLDTNGPSPMYRGLALIQPPHVGRAKVVRGQRIFWEALQMPKGEMRRQAEEGLSIYHQGLVSFPHAAVLIEMLEYDAEPENFVNNHAGSQVLYRTFLRATEHGVPSATIKRDDLLSPYDGKPIGYRWDGKTMELDLRGVDDFSVKKVYFPPKPSVVP